MKRTLICNKCDAMFNSVEWGDNCPACGEEDAMEFPVTCADCKASVARSRAVELGTIYKTHYCDYCTEERLKWHEAYTRNICLSRV